MRKNSFIVIMLIGILLLLGCEQSQKNMAEVNRNEITIFAAASLKEALYEIKPQFEQNNNIKLIYNLAASGTLQKQIEEGAPADLFISAGVKQMDALEDKRLIDKDSRINLLKNRLVLVVAKEYKDRITAAEDLIDLDVKLCIGEPEAVPAGQYARESLKNMGLWDKLNSKLVLAKDVKQVLTYVEKGELAAGIVYSSDVAVMKDSIVAQSFRENTHSPIVYPLAIVAASKDKSSAKTFADYLMADEAQRVFKKYGFSIEQR